MRPEYLRIQAKSLMTTGQIAWNMASSRRQSPWVSLFTEIQQSAGENYPNPKAKEIFAKMQRIMTINQGSLIFDMVPWATSGETISHITLLNTLMTHFNYHDYTIDTSLFPSNEALEFIDAVVKKSTDLNRAVTIPEQFETALEIAGKYPTAAALIAHAGSRAIGRNKDSKLDPRFRFTAEQIKTWGNAIARFGDDKYSEVLGDNYHFWAYCAAGMFIEAHKPNPANKVTREIFYYGPNLLRVSRAVATLGTQPLSFQHKNVARMGFLIGSKLGKNSKVSV